MCYAACTEKNEVLQTLFTNRTSVEVSLKPPPVRFTSDVFISAAHSLRGHCIIGPWKPPATARASIGAITPFPLELIYLGGISVIEKKTKYYMHDLPLESTNRT